MEYIIAILIIILIVSSVVFYRLGYAEGWRECLWIYDNNGLIRGTDRDIEQKKKEYVDKHISNITEEQKTTKDKSVTELLDEMLKESKI